MRRCRRCWDEKPATLEFWHKNKKSDDGLHVYCKVCRSDIHKEYMKDPIIGSRVRKQVREWQKGVGKDKYIISRKRYDKSPKRVDWRHRRFFAMDGETGIDLDEALDRLEKLRKERGLETG